jgi:hypothetical protein
MRTVEWLKPWGPASPAALPSIAIADTTQPNRGEKVYWEIHMPRKYKKSPNGEMTPKVMAADQVPSEYPIACTSVLALQIYHNPERKPDCEGPWSGEADKIGWIDEETGLRCIMLRQKDGTLSGYVGVDIGHPLFGYDSQAIPLELSNSVHGGISYAKACEDNRFAKVRGEPRSERYTVCHVTRVRKVTPIETVRTTEDEFPDDDVWWLGFDTNHRGDLVPRDPFGRSSKKRGVYRDQSYVYSHCIALARRLKAIEDATDSSANDPAKPLRLSSLQHPQDPAS